MFCTKCGSKLPDGANFCSVCGTRVAESVAEVKFDKALDFDFSEETKKEAAAKPAEGPMKSRVTFDWSNVIDEPHRKVVDDIKSPWGTTGSIDEKELFSEMTPSTSKSRTMSFIDVLKAEKEEAKKATLSDIPGINSKPEDDKIVYTEVLDPGYLDEQIPREPEKPQLHIAPLYEDIGEPVKTPFDVAEEEEPFLDREPRFEEPEEAPVIDEPVFEEPEVETPAEEPVEEPAFEAPAEEPVVEEPVIDEPEVKPGRWFDLPEFLRPRSENVSLEPEPEAEEPAEEPEEAPAVEEPVFDEPAEEPVVETPAEEPAVEEPVFEEPEFEDYESLDFTPYAGRRATLYTVEEALNPTEPEEDDEDDFVEEPEEEPVFEEPEEEIVEEPAEEYEDAAAEIEEMIRRDTAEEPGIVDKTGFYNYAEDDYLDINTERQGRSRSYEWEEPEEELEEEVEPEAEEPVIEKPEDDSEGWESIELEPEVEDEPVIEEPVVEEPVVEEAEEPAEAVEEEPAPEAEAEPEPEEEEYHPENDYLAIDEDELFAEMAETEPKHTGMTIAAPADRESEIEALKRRLAELMGTVDEEPEVIEKPDALDLNELVEEPVVEEPEVVEVEEPAVEEPEVVEVEEPVAEEPEAVEVEEPVVEEPEVVEVEEPVVEEPAAEEFVAPEIEEFFANEPAEEPAVEEKPAEPTIDDILAAVLADEAEPAPEGTVSFADIPAEEPKVEDIYATVDLNAPVVEEPAVEVAEPVEVEAPAPAVEAAEVVEPVAEAEPVVEEPAKPESDAMSLEELVFGETMGEEAEVEATKKIDKFYTLYRKNEEFQRLLDEEYNKLKAAGGPAPEPVLPDPEPVRPVEDATIYQAIDKPLEEYAKEQAAAKAAGAQFSVEGAEGKKSSGEVKAEGAAVAAAATAAVAGAVASGKGNAPEVEYEEVDKGGGFLTVLAVIIALLLVFLLVVILVLNFAPTSGLAQQINGIIENITSHFTAIESGVTLL